MRINPPPAGSIVVKTFGYAPNLGWLITIKTHHPNQTFRSATFPN